MIPQAAPPGRRGLRNLLLTLGLVVFVAVGLFFYFRYQGSMNPVLGVGR